MDAGEKSSSTPPREDEVANASPEPTLPEAAHAASDSGSLDTPPLHADLHEPHVSSDAEQITPADAPSHELSTDLEPPSQAPADTGPLTSPISGSPDDFAAVLAREPAPTEETETIIVAPTDAAPTVEPALTALATQPGGGKASDMERVIGTADTSPQEQPAPQPEYASSEYAPQAEGAKQDTEKGRINPAVWVLGALLLLLLVAGVTAFALNLGKSGAGGSTATPADLAQTFYQRLGNHDYTGAHSLLTEGVSAGNSAEEFKTAWEEMEAQTNARFQSAEVSNVVEQGDSATASVKVKLTGNVELEPVKVAMQKINNRWLITGFE